MGLQLSEVEKDPLVQKTLKAFIDAIKEDYGDSTISPQDRHLVPQLDLEVFKVLADTDALDSVSAAVLSVSHLSTYVSFNRVAKDIDGEVAAVMRLMDPELGAGPEELITSGNPTALKLMIAAVTTAVTQEHLDEMVANLPPSELRSAIGEIGDMVVGAVEQLIADKRWVDVPPRLLDAFMVSIDRLGEAAPGRFQKRVFRDIVQDLKTEIAKGAAAEMTTASAAPQIDPDSRFEQLKDNARKFRPGV